MRLAVSPPDVNRQRDRGDGEGDQEQPARHGRPRAEQEQEVTDDPGPLKGGQTHALSALWARRTYLSGEASTHVRTSALAGLAVAWLFAGGTSGDLSTLATAPTGLLIAAAVFAASLGSDILHYYAGAEVFRHVARRAEKRGKSHEAPVTLHPVVPGVLALFYNLKVVLLFAGYVVLVIVFLSAV